MYIKFNYANFTINNLYDRDTYLSDDDPSGEPDLCDDYLLPKRARRLRRQRKQRSIKTVHVYGFSIMRTVRFDISYTCDSLGRESNIAICNPLCNYIIETYNGEPYEIVIEGSYIYHIGPISNVIFSSMKPLSIHTTTPWPSFGSPEKTKVTLVSDSAYIKFSLYGQPNLLAHDSLLYILDYHYMHEYLDMRSMQMMYDPNRGVPKETYTLRPVIFNTATISCHTNNVSAIASMVVSDDDSSIVTIALYGGTPIVVDMSEYMNVIGRDPNDHLYILDNILMSTYVIVSKITRHLGHGFVLSLHQKKENNVSSYRRKPLRQPIVSNGFHDINILFP